HQHVAKRKQRSDLRQRGPVRHHFCLEKRLDARCIMRSMSVTNESLPLPNRMQPAGEELANSVSHGFGLVGAVIGTPILLLAAFYHGSLSFLIGTAVFTVTMLLVYLASTLYHCWPRTHTKSLLQVLDHSAIFLLIAGTYTPF